VLTEDAVVDAFASAHLAAARVPYSDDHELVVAARLWFNTLRARCDDATPTATADGLTCAQFLAVARALLATELRAPDWLTAVCVAQYALATRSDDDGDAGAEEGMTKDAFVAWRTAVQRCTPQQLARATRSDGWGEHAPTLEDMFHGADFRRKGRVTAEDWLQLVHRFWACSEPWDELNAFSL
jgi:hypothetical protein